MNDSTQVLHDLSPAEYAARRGISLNTVYRHIAAGHTRAVRVGPKLLRIPVSELERGL